ncbi:MAG: hypothetical protein ACXAC8_10790 [Candidatus Hodarchaeales archaeon]|jgi:hypothetical protein
MERNSPFYGLGLLLVSTITFLFVFFVLPTIPAPFNIIILIGMFLLMSFGFVLRYRRLVALSRVQQENVQTNDTDQYIKQIDEIMKKS